MDIPRFRRHLVPDLLKEKTETFSTVKTIEKNDIFIGEGAC
jgi:hypothetical protein